MADVLVKHSEIYPLLSFALPNGLQQPGWERSRELDVAGRPDGRKNAGNKEEDHLNAVAFQPSMGEHVLTYQDASYGYAGTMNTLYYRGHWLRITRAKDNPSRRYSRSSLKIRHVSSPPAPPLG